MISFVSLDSDDEAPCLYADGRSSNPQSPFKQFSFDAKKVRDCSTEMNYFNIFVFDHSPEPHPWRPPQQLIHASILLVTRGGSALAGMRTNSQLQRWLKADTNFYFNDGSGYDSPDFATPTPAPAVPAAGNTPLVMLKNCR